MHHLYHTRTELGTKDRNEHTSVQCVETSTVQFDLIYMPHQLLHILKERGMCGYEYILQKRSRCFPRDAFRMQ